MDAGLQHWLMITDARRPVAILGPESTCGARALWLLPPAAGLLSPATLHANRVAWSCLATCRARRLFLCWGVSPAFESGLVNGVSEHAN
jgi:hypothetical protein